MTPCKPHDTEYLKKFTPVSRWVDPLSSKLAEQEINRIGLRSRQQEVVFQAVRKYPNHTSKELCAITGIDRYTLGRRLSEISVPVDVVVDPFFEELWDVKRGPMRKCNIGNRLALTWELV